ncbi:unnamed protein product [Schistocephalus solidus]|uniref:Nucleos_tra2_N domain-containing protein n=1 Tax=Schistocephalus solidus TaxID=70667 RepID=A0A183T4E3_SCHSO|nr:unnamed protein product [Schistocephalus solidus]
MCPGSPHALTEASPVLSLLLPFHLHLREKDDTESLKTDEANEATTVHFFEPNYGQPSLAHVDVLDLEATSSHAPSNPVNRLLQAYSNFRLRLVRVCWHRPQSPSAADIGHRGLGAVILPGILLTLTVALLVIHLTIGAGRPDRGEAMHFICVFSFLLLCQIAALYSHLVRLRRQGGGCPELLTRLGEVFKRWGRHLRNCFCQPWCLYIILSVILLIFLIFFVIRKNPSNLVSLSGILFMICLCILLSFHPGKINWRPVFMGFFIQFCLAVVTLQTKFGYKAFQYVGAHVANLMKNGLSGAHFVFGDLVRQGIFAFTVSLYFWPKRRMCGFFRESTIEPSPP